MLWKEMPLILNALWQSHWLMFVSVDFMLKLMIQHLKLEKKIRQDFLIMTQFLGDMFYFFFLNFCNLSHASFFATECNANKYLYQFISIWFIYDKQDRGSGGPPKNNSRWKSLILCSISRLLLSKITYLLTLCWLGFFRSFRHKWCSSSTVEISKTFLTLGCRGHWCDQI